MFYGKSRGQRRKLRRLLWYIDRIEPFKETDKEFEHFHMPCPPWLAMPKTSGRVKTEACRRLLKKTEEIILSKPDNLPFCKVVVAITYPNVRDSQIIIFYDEFYYSTFWQRNNQYQVWTPITTDKSFAKERGIDTSLAEKGYVEELFDEDYQTRTYIWFYGESP